MTYHLVATIVLVFLSISISSIGVVCTLLLANSTNRDDLWLIISAGAAAIIFLFVGIFIVVRLAIGS